MAYLCTLLLAVLQAEERPALWRVIDALAEQNGLAAEEASVLAHLAGVPAATASVNGRLPCVLEMIAEPWSVPSRAAELLDCLAAPLTTRGAGWTEMPGRIRAWLAIAPPAGEDPDLAEMDELWNEIAEPSLAGADLLAKLDLFVAAAGRVALRARSSWSEADARTIMENTPAFLEAWYRSHFPGAALPKDRQELIDQVLAAASAASGGRELLLAAAERLLRLAEPELLDAIGKRLAKTPRAEGPPPAGCEGDARAWSGGTILGGPGKSEYRASTALVIDLGGNDIYEPTPEAATAPVSVVLDLEGNDRYARAACTIGGIALVLDRSGKDTYTGGRFSTAATAFGCALLVDLRGDDVYEAEDFAQGYALCGVALLCDAEGNDRFDAFAYAQGASNGPGLAALVDGSGDDRYFADGHWPDVYGDSGPESFHGASQGYSSGIRPALPGGLAACIDLGDGADSYQSGNFSQGGGYYFSFGLLFDGGGDDENRGYRYSQGFGVHQAVGMRWDAGGDDRYATRSVASLGMGWDEGVGWFADDSGDDVYESGGLALGGAAQTAIAVCVDGGGDDRYVSAGAVDCQGGSGGSEYHGLPALGVLVDLGAGKDSYSREGRADALELGSAGCGLFVDAREKTIEKLLARLEHRKKQ